MKKMLMIVAMIGVIGMAGAPSALASRPVTGTDLDFFDPASWQSGGVPGETVFDSIQWGYQLIGDHSMIYDPATTGDPLVYQVGTAHSGDIYVLGAMDAAAGSYTFTQQSGDVEWAYGPPGPRRHFLLGSSAEGTYVMNGGTARFPGVGLRLYSAATHNSLFDHNAGDVLVTGIRDDGLGLQIGVAYEGPLPHDGTATYNLGGGTLRTEGLTIFVDGVLNFDAGSTGVLFVNESHTTVTNINDLIIAGRIVDLGGEGFLVTDVGAYTEVKLDLPPIPEPAGLGLIGLALLAVRKRRS